jgi:uncharacterized membrane protein
MVNDTTVTYGNKGQYLGHSQPGIVKDTREEFDGEGQWKRTSIESKPERKSERAGGGSRGGGGGGGFGGELAEILLFVAFFPVVLMFWAFVGSVYVFMALFGFKPNAERAKETSWGLLGIFFVGEIFVGCLGFLVWSVRIALTNPIPTAGDLVLDCLLLVLEALVVWFFWWLLKLVGRITRKAARENSSDSPESDTTPQAAWSRRIVTFSGAVVMLSIFGALVHHFRVTGWASQSDRTVFPVCGAARDVVASERKPEIKFGLNESCWSGWVTLPNTWSKFRVEGPGYLDFLFQDGRRVHLHGDATQWPAAPPGHVFRLRGPGVATLKTTTRLVCPPYDLCRTEYQLSLKISPAESKTPRAKSRSSK